MWPVHHYRNPSYPWRTKCHEFCEHCCGAKLARYYTHNSDLEQWRCWMSEKKRIALVRKVAIEAANDNGASLVVPKGMAALYPAVSEYMSALCFEDGSEREVSTLTFMLEDELLKGCVNDRANRRSI